MIAAWFFVHHRAWFKGWWKVAVSFGIVLATIWELNRINGLQNVGSWRIPWIDWEAGMWALVILTYVATLRSNNIISRSVARIGELSFSIYLLHFMLLQIVITKHWFIRLDGLTGRENAYLTTVAVLLPLVLTVSWFTYNGVEKPFLNLRMRYLKPLEDEPTPAPAAEDRATYRPRHEPADDAVPVNGQVPFSRQQGADEPREDGSILPVT
jgi:peptidoglycan/LPS O-acetylase OafA/YrhL